MTSILSVLSSWRPVNVLVVGDFMLDQTVFGDAERLSPDAPVPVLAVRRTESRPGGAANVCMDLVAMQANVRAVGVIGGDDEGRTLRESLGLAGVDGASLVVDRDRPTTLKSSVVGLAQHRHPQKMFRIDRESRAPIDGGIEAALLQAVERSLAWADVVCIEDYDKGVCTPAVCRAVIERTRGAGKPALVDPAAIKDYGKYRGATAITPNRSEAERAAGVTLAHVPERAPDLVDAWGALARRLLDQHALEVVVVTLDRHGALLLERGGEPQHLPTVARKVYDVTGAGDMVLAALAPAIGNRAGWREAVQFANAAAGLEVEVFGAEPIPLERIHHALLLDHGRLAGKTRTAQDCRIEVAAHRREGRKVVFTNGVFDLIHAGHIALLRQAKAFGDYLVVGVNSDASVKRLKGPERPVHGERDRAEILGELSCVDAVVVFEEDTPVSLIEALRPDVLVKGGDYRPDQVVGAELVESYGGRVEIVPTLEGRSTTGAISRIRAGGAPPSPAKR